MAVSYNVVGIVSPESMISINEDNVKIKKSCSLNTKSVMN